MAQVSKFKIKVAQLISIITYPLIMSIWGGLIIKSNHELSIQELFIILSPFISIVLGYIIFVVSIKKSTDIDFSDRKNRPALLIITGLALLISILIAKYIDSILCGYLRNLLIVIIIAATISFKWKISLHALGTTAFIALAISILGSQYIFLIFLLPIVYWARIILKKHTIWQLLAGSLVSLIIIF